ncbi:hypothetical protein ACN38_g1977 [Penicillium nordicum]|uniref:Uncharacterized protein n=1 Tax=Penicillium nordicum TaxID=229535 RepID=A0A0M8PEQ3_9EURO|nr:hypothetical protein ACN38_g1977 [Penicillium nordicum]
MNVPTRLSSYQIKLLYHIAGSTSRFSSFCKYTVLSKTITKMTVLCPYILFLLFLVHASTGLPINPRAKSEDSFSVELLQVVARQGRRPWPFCWRRGPLGPPDKGGRSLLLLVGSLCHRTVCHFARSMPTTY